MSTAEPEKSGQILGALAAEVSYDEETDPVCAWNRCEVTEPLVDPATGDWWCMEHLGDELLPPMKMGGLSACTACGKTAIWHTDDGRTYHPRCRREAAKQPPKTTKRLGAYGRRKKP